KKIDRPGSAAPAGVVTSSARMRPTRPTATLLVLFVLNALNFFDRNILGAIVEPLRREWGLRDAQIGWIGTAFTLIYAVVGLPLGRLADTAPRTWLLGG